MTREYDNIGAKRHCLCYKALLQKERPGVTLTSIYRSGGNVMVETWIENGLLAQSVIIDTSKTVSGTLLISVDGYSVYNVQTGKEKK